MTKILNYVALISVVLIRVALVGVSLIVVSVVGIYFIVAYHGAGTTQNKIIMLVSYEVNLAKASVQNY